MAVKATVYIEGVVPHDDMRFTPRVTIKVGGSEPEVLEIETKLDPSATSGERNLAILQFVQRIIVERYRVQYDALLDSVIIVNPFGVV